MTTQAAMTPAEALARLREGNARFVANRQMERDLLQQVRETGGGQLPLYSAASTRASRRN